jgi:2-oxoisovalerate dehydrogenase E1 component
LDAPVRRIAAMDTFCGYHPHLEDAILPQSDMVVASVRKLLDY